jgi:hypothetical protein
MSEATRSASRRLNAYQRHRGPDDPVTLRAARDLRAVSLEEHIRRVVDAAPPLTSEQRQRLAILLSTPARSDAT